MTATMPTTTTRVVTAVRYVAESKAALERFRQQHAAILDELDGFERDLDANKRALAAIMHYAGVTQYDNGSIRVRLVAQDNGHYDPELLPADVRDNPAVTVLTAPKLNVQAAVKLGLLSDEQAGAAWVPNPARPYVKVTGA